MFIKLPRVLCDLANSGYEMIKPPQVQIYWYDTLHRGTYQEDNET